MLFSWWTHSRADLAWYSSTWTFYTTSKIYIRTSHRSSHWSSWTSHHRLGSYNQSQRDHPVQCDHRPGAHYPSHPHWTHYSGWLASPFLLKVPVNTLQSYCLVLSLVTCKLYNNQAAETKNPHIASFRLVVYLVLIVILQGVMAAVFQFTYNYALVSTILSKEWPIYKPFFTDCI